GHRHRRAESGRLRRSALAGHRGPHPPLNRPSRSAVDRPDARLPSRRPGARVAPGRLVLPSPRRTAMHRRALPPVGAAALATPTSLTPAAARGPIRSRYFGPLTGHLSPPAT